MKPTDYKGFYKKLSEWRGESLRFFAKRETNEQRHDIRPYEVLHVKHENEPKTWSCCGREIAVRDSLGNLEKCPKCHISYYQTFLHKLTLGDFKEQ